MKKDIIKYLEKKDNDIKELNLKNFKLTEIPDLSKFKNLKVLDLSINKIKKIENIPKTVHTLILSNNKIEKIINIPLHIKILFVNKNLLTELDITETDIVELYCERNKLTRILFSKNLNVLKCSYNKIINLDNLPDGLTYCDCSHNKIKYFNKLPNELITLNCSFNKLFILEKIPPNLTYLNIATNKICEINSLPLGLEHLYCSFNKLKTIKLSENLIKFDGSYNNLSLIELNDKLELLIISNNNLSDLPELPDSLTLLACCNIGISKIIVPIDLVELYCNNCKKLNKIYFNNKLELLSCEHTLIDNLDEIPDSLLELYCAYTKVTKINNTLNNLKCLNIEGNNFSESDIKYFDLNINYFQC